MISRSRGHHIAFYELVFLRKLLLLWLQYGDAPAAVSVEKSKIKKREKISASATHNTVLWLCAISIVTFFVVRLGDALVPRCPVETGAMDEEGVQEQRRSRSFQGRSCIAHQHERVEGSVNQVPSDQCSFWDRSSMLIRWAWRCSQSDSAGEDIARNRCRNC